MATFGTGIGAGICPAVPPATNLGHTPIIVQAAAPVNKMAAAPKGQGEAGVT
jgi:hypothetical protein